MWAYKQILVILIAIALAGCMRLPSSVPTTTPTNFKKQPEPQQPLITGNITGIPEGALVRVHIRTPEGWEAIVVNRKGSGIWETVLTKASGVDYIVTAEVQDFVSTPISYTLHLEDTKVYFVENRQVTDQEAVNLDFEFAPR
jgi:hypothetical protein